MQTEVYAQFYELEKAHWWFIGMREIYRKQIETINPGSPYRILDIGCGTGYNLSFLKQWGWTCGLDYSAIALKFCQDNGETTTAQASGNLLPFVDNSFDLVTALGVIEHLDDDISMLADMYRVCRMSGHALVMTSAHPWLWSHHDDTVFHKRRYLFDELASKFRQAGFDLVRYSYVNSFLFPIIAPIRLLQRAINYQPPKEEGVKGFEPLPYPLNDILIQIMKLEANILTSENLPMGVGLICLAQKTG